MNKLLPPILTSFCIVLVLWFYVIGANAQTIVWTKKANPVLNAVNSVAFTSDGNKVISGTNCHPASIRIMDVQTGEIEWDYSVASPYMCIMGVTFSANSQYIAAIEEFGNVFLFDNRGKTPELLHTLKTGTQYGFSTAISPDNTQVAVGCSNGKLMVFTIADGKNIQNINAHTGWVTTVCYSPDGNFIITGGSDNSIKVWDKNGVLVTTCTGHTDDITCVKISPDSKFLVSSGKDNYVRIWDIYKGNPVRSIQVRKTDVLSVDISSDGTRIAAASSDGYCSLADFNSGAIFHTFGLPDSGAVNSIVWSPNGKNILTGNTRSDIVLWDVSTVGIIENELENSSVLFPNPVTNSVTISIPFDMGTYSVRLCTNQGKTMVPAYSEQLHAITVDCRDLPEGIYYIGIRYMNKDIIHPFIVQR